MKVMACRRRSANRTPWRSRVLLRIPAAARRRIPLVGNRLSDGERREEGAKRAEGVAAMAHGRLGLITHLSEGPPKRRVEEDRVVAEAAGPLRGGCDLPLDGPPRVEEDLSVPDEREGADEPRRTVRSTGRPQRVVNQCKLLRIRRLLATVPRRQDSGGAIESVDLEA